MLHSRDMPRAATWLVAASAVLGCYGDQSLTSRPRHAVADISDGAHDAPGFPSNPHYFFLPPLVDSPSATGVFNPRLSPVVQICNQNVTPCPSDQVHALFTTTTGSGSETVQLDPTGPLYVVNWDTDPATEPLGASYRIAVLVRDQTLGFADVVMVASGSIEDPGTGAVIPLKDGRTLPIKFLVEEGALCPANAGLDCVEQVASPTADNTIVTRSGLAGAFIPAGALSQPVTVSIVADTARPCIPSPFALAQYPGCYQFFADPGPTPFNLPVTVGMCVQTDLPLTVGAELEIFRFDPGLPVVALEETSAGFLPCDATDPYRLPSIGGRGSIVRTLLALARSVLLPRPLYAAHDGLGGMTDSFSTFSWVLPAGMVSQVVPLPIGTAGAPVLSPPAVLLQDMSSLHLPVAGVTVTFRVEGGGSITNSSVVTGADGLASVGAWLLGAVPGVNRVIATAVGAIGSPDTFTVIGVSPLPFP